MLLVWWVPWVSLLILILMTQTHWIVHRIAHRGIHSVLNRIHRIKHWIPTLSLIVRYVSIRIVILITMGTVLRPLILVSVHLVVPLIDLGIEVAILIPHRIVVPSHWVYPRAHWIVPTHSIVKLRLSVWRSVILHVTIR